VLEQLEVNRATGFATDWEDSFGNNQVHASMQMLCMHLFLVAG
jgi:hypothetical protein